MLPAANTIREANLRLLISCVALMATSSAHAGASLLVDDATVTPPGQCQVEAWARDYSRGQELTAVPACNYANNEFGLGISDFFNPDIGVPLSLGIKHLWRDLDQSPWGIASSIGVTWNASHHRIDQWSFNLPVSVVLDKWHHLTLHTNLGFLDTPGVGRGLSGGLGIEQVLSAKSVLLAEIYAQYDHVRIEQAGLRREVNDSVSVDVLVGHQDQLATGAWFITLGFNVALH